MLKPFLTILATLLVISCSEPEEFKTLGDNVAGPIDITESATHFYVLNADIDRVYNEGSIMALDTNGNPVSTVSTPRMGRFLVIRDNTLIAGFGPTDQYETPAQIKFYDISNPENITLQKSITMDCSPVNAVSPSNYQYFAVSCLGGKIYMGTWGASLQDTELKFVRQPDSKTRRALYIDTSRNLLLAFTTDYSLDQGFRDARYLDQSSYDESFTETSGANEVPDNLESSQDILDALDRSGNDLQYKFLVYDIDSESAKGFPSIENDSPDAKLEMRWLYFESNRSKIEFATGEKYYRSNFWMTLPHESDPNSFYISQRGNEITSPDSNAIFKFRITADPLPSGGQAPTTASFLTVTAAYGYETEPTVPALQRFTHNFATATTNSQNYFVVNEFKDKSIKSEYFTSTSANYALGFQTTAGEKIGVKNNSNRTNAYFAVGAIGNKVLAGSFYSNQLILFQVAPGSDIKQIRTIN